jgi:hypothetical protein
MSSAWLLLRVDRVMMLELTQIRIQLRSCSSDTTCNTTDEMSVFWNEIS